MNTVSSQINLIQCILALYEGGYVGHIFASLGSVIQFNRIRFLHIWQKTKSGRAPHLWADTHDLSVFYL